MDGLTREGQKAVKKGYKILIIRQGENGTISYEYIDSSVKEQQANKRKRLLNSSSESDTNTPDRRRPKKSLVSSLQRKHTRTNFLSSLDDLSDGDD